MFHGAIARICLQWELDEGAVLPQLLDIGVLGSKDERGWRVKW
jgi:hypothetical protein